MKTLNRWQDRVAQAMQDVQGTGTFAVQGDVNLPDPGLLVDAVGAIRVPIRASDARKLIAIAKQAPFGRGTQTVVGTAVRRCWARPPLHRLEFPRVTPRFIPTAATKFASSDQAIASAWFITSASVLRWPANAALPSSSALRRRRMPCSN